LPSCSKRTRTTPIPPELLDHRSLKMPPLSHRYLALMTLATKPTNYCGGALLLLALVVPILLSRTPVYAQVAKVENPEPKKPQRYRTSTIDSRVSLLAKGLDLTEAQQSAVKKILEERRQQSLRIRQNASISGGDRIEQFRILQQSTVARIRAVLNEEQRKKYDPFASQKIQQTPERSVEDWLKLTTPH
jgi:Spy/CpxP family protein refolding chaperone